MKKIGITLLIALIGGVIAIGGYKLLEKKDYEALTLEEKQNVFYTNNPKGANIKSSTGNLDFTEAAEAVSPGVVNINVTIKQQGRRGRGGGSPFDMFEEFFGRPDQRRQQPREAQASGSGVIVSPDGYIITNNHVVEEANKIEVKLTDNRVFEAKVIGKDKNSDLALVKISATNLPIVKFGDSDNVRIGEWVLAVGYPLTLESTVTAGIVSAMGRNLGLLGERQQDMYGQDDIPINTGIESFIQTDAVINRGNSGGALVNANGELIGINTAIASPTGYYSGYGFAIPINLAKKIMDDFIEFGRVNRGLIGVTFTELNRDIAKELGVDEVSGLIVRGISKGGAAEEVGMKEGDIITKLEGKNIRSSSDLQEHVYRLRPGDKVKLTYKRDGKEKNVTVTLKPEEDVKSEKEEEASQSATEIYNKLGAGFIPAPDNRKKEVGVESGVVVSEVHRDGLFSYFGVERGLLITHVNGQSVNDADQVEKALEKTSRNSVKITGVPSRGSTVELNISIDY